MRGMVQRSRFAGRNLRPAKPSGTQKPRRRESGRRNRPASLGMTGGGGKGKSEWRVGREERCLTCTGRPFRRSERARKSRPVPFGMTNNKRSGVEGGLDVGGAVAVEAGGGDGL